MITAIFEYDTSIYQDCRFSTTNWSGSVLPVINRNKISFVSFYKGSYTIGSLYQRSWGRFCTQIKRSND